ncbi:copper chaperone [Vanrija albida]|uniref:Superoxide dismutase 1 copper chaperone n=1 Tax=Vanrija albida TaxID=181172 RepID=A0ABR3QBR8_9TREE
MVLASAAFKTEFAVDMTCQNCVTAVNDALRDVPGIERYDIELENKRVTITGKTPPSQLLSALKSTHRQVLVRGASAADSSVPSQAAVSILESPVDVPTDAACSATPLRDIPGMNEAEFSQKVFGIARYVQVAPKSVLLDLTVRIPKDEHTTPASVYHAYVSKTGNLVDPPSTTGGAYVDLGAITLDKDGYGDLFKEVDGEIWEWIGRATVVEAKDVPAESKSIGSIFAGVVARSSGAWGNDKTVCACSGRTMWEEGREMERKGLL